MQPLLTGMGWRVKLDGTSPLVFRCASVVSTVAVHLWFVLTAADLLDCADHQTRYWPASETSFLWKLSSSPDVNFFRTLIKFIGYFYVPLWFRSRRLQFFTTESALRKMLE